MLLRAAMLVLAVALTVAVSLLGRFANRSRRQLAQFPGVFRYKRRRVGTDSSGRRALWPKRTALAAWAHDVPLVQLGRLPATVQVLPDDDELVEVTSSAAARVCWPSDSRSHASPRTASGPIDGRPATDLVLAMTGGVSLRLRDDALARRPGLRFWDPAGPPRVRQRLADAGRPCRPVADSPLRVKDVAPDRAGPR